jgi:predicted anti-sigma-YlaC factor YlaD
MQITHEEAHRLIQFNIDGTLDLNNQETLNTHLRGCADCRVYSDEVKETVSTLREIMRKHWNLRPCLNGCSLHIKIKEEVQEYY